MLAERKTIVTEITYEEARAQQVKALIAEFPEAKYLSGPKVRVDSMRMEYCIRDVRSGAEFTIIDQREDGPGAMQFRIRAQMKANFPKQAG